MSNRHRAARSAVPGATRAAPTKEERRASNRRNRRITHEVLARVDEDAAEGVVTPKPKHDTIDLDPNEVTAQAQNPARKRENRHWKQKFWKRRNNERARRAELTLEVE